MSNLENINQLVKDINNIDTFYEMSDSSSIIEKGHNNVKETIKKFNSSKDKQKVIESLSTVGKINFERYFKMV